MSAKYTFRLQSEKQSRPFPHKLIIGQTSTETTTDVLLHFLAYVLFFRERLQRHVNLDTDTIPFVPDLVQLDYELRPKLWVECGECGLQKLHKLAIKAPEADIWIVKPCESEALELKEAMVKKDLRTNRYSVIGFDHDMFEELQGLLTERNAFFWVAGSLDPPRMQFEFNELWFDTVFILLRH